MNTREYYIVVPKQFHKAVLADIVARNGRATVTRNNERGIVILDATMPSDMDNADYVKTFLKLTKGTGSIARTLTPEEAEETNERKEELKKEKIQKERNNWNQLFALTNPNQ
jgi:predicted membrane GTPase involved in stress response